MNRFNFSLFFVFIFTTMAFADAIPRRFIFLIHGMNATEKSFMSLPSILKEHGELIQPDYDLKVIPFSYQVGTKKLGPYEYASQFSNFLKESIPVLNPSDRITIVGHSQGGLIAWIWYLGSIDLGKEFNRPFQSLNQYAKQTEGILTLATPFSGTKAGNIIKTSALTLAITNLKAKIGGKEIQEISNGSDTTYKVRQSLIKLSQNGKTLPIRTESIAGVVPVSYLKGIFLNLYQKLAWPGVTPIMENDLTVPISSARNGLIYLRSDKQFNHDIGADDFGTSSLGNFHIIQGAHGAFSNLPGMIEVPESCRNVTTTCNNPTYGLILKFTMACTNEIQNCQTQEYQKLINHFLIDKNHPNTDPKAIHVDDNMHNFMLDIVLDLPSDYVLPSKRKLIAALEFEMNHQGVVRHNNPMYDRYYFIVKKPGEIRSVTVNTDSFNSAENEFYKKQIRFTVYGQVFSNHDVESIFKSQFQEGFRLPFQIKLPGLEPKKIEALVRPTYTTFIGLNFL